MRRRFQATSLGIFGTADYQISRLNKELKVEYSETFGWTIFTPYPGIGVQLDSFNYIVKLRRHIRLSADKIVIFCTGPAIHATRKLEIRTTTPSPMPNNSKDSRARHKSTIYCPWVRPVMSVNQKEKMCKRLNIRTVVK